MDVDYRDSYAIAAGILFNDWRSDVIKLEKTIIVDKVLPYQSGEFYKRELPCLKQLIDSLNKLPSLFIIDGFVYLDNNKNHGLGGYLYKEYKSKIPVIGVAKNNFKNCDISTQIIRGKSLKPLYVTSFGIDQEIASKSIKQMHGKNRIPTLLKKVDKLCRKT